MLNWEMTSPNRNVNKKINWSKGILYVIKYAIESVHSKLPHKTDNKIESTAELPAPVLGTYVTHLFVLSQLMHWITHFQYLLPKLHRTAELHSWLYRCSWVDSINVCLKIHKADKHRQIEVIIFAQSSAIFYVIKFCNSIWTPHSLQDVIIFYVCS